MLDVLQLAHLAAEAVELAASAEDRPLTRRNALPARSLASHHDSRGLAGTAGIVLSSIVIEELVLVRGIALSGDKMTRRSTAGFTANATLPAASVR